MNYQTMGLSTLATAALGFALCACSSDTSADRTSAARIYATVSKSAEVLVIDDASHDVVGSIAVGKGPAIILATPDEKKLYTANWADNSISAIDVATQKVTNIPLADRPYVIAMAPDGRHLFAGINQVNQIAVVDIATDTVARSFDSGGLAASIIVSPDSETLYVAKLGNLIGNGTLEAYSAAGAMTKPQITVGGSPAWITIGKDGSKVYTLNFTSDDISVVDTQSWQVTATIRAAAGSQGIIGNVTPDGSRLYVTNHGTADMIAIDTATNAIVQTIPIDGKPVGVQFSADGKRVYTTDFGPASKMESPLIGLRYLTSGAYESQSPGTVRVFDTQTGAPVGEAVVTAPGATSIVVLASDEE